MTTELFTKADGALLRSDMMHMVWKTALGAGGVLIIAQVLLKKLGWL